MFSARKGFAVSLLTALVALAMSAACPALAQTSYMGSTTGQPTFNRPEGGNPPSGLSGNGTATRYHTYSFMPTETAQYRIVSTATNWDNFVVVYQGTFNPASPMTNCLAANEDFSNTTTAGVDAITLQASQTYIIVVCGSTNFGSGSFETVITQLPPTTATTGNSTWARPNANGSNPPVSVSSLVTQVPYVVTQFTVPETGNYRVTSVSTTPGFNNFTVLYQNSFSAFQPLQNAVIANEDYAASTSGFDIALTASTNYFLVTTGSLHDDYGAFTTSVQRIYRLQANGDTTGRPVFRRPNANGSNPPVSLSTSGTAVPYRLYIITVGATGFYNFTVTRTTTGYDPFTALYAGNFDPAQPLANGVMANDDKPTQPFSGFDNVPLMNGVLYYLVVTGFNNGDFGQYTLDVTSLSGSITLEESRVITGTVSLDDCPGVAFSATFTLHPSDNSGNIVRTIPVAANGDFTLYDLPAKNFQIKVKAFNTLSRVVSANAIASDVLGLSVPALLGGDGDNSNIVEVNDLGLLIEAFDAERDIDPDTPGDQSAPNWNPNVDFNCNGVVDQEDLAIFIENFDASGEDFE